MGQTTLSSLTPWDPSIPRPCSCIPSCSPRTELPSHPSATHVSLISTELRGDGGCETSRNHFCWKRPPSSWKVLAKVSAQSCGLINLNYTSFVLAAALLLWEGQKEPRAAPGSDLSPRSSQLPVSSCFLLVTSVHTWSQ